MIDFESIRTMGILIGALVAINGLTLWAIKMMLGRHQDHLDKKLETRDNELDQRDRRQDDRLTRLEDEFKEFELGISEKFMRRDDYVQSFGRIEQKIDAIWEYIRDRLVKPLGDK